MNRAVIIGIIIVVVIGIGAAVMAANYNELEENPDSISIDENSEPKQYTITIQEEVGFREQPP